MIPREIDDLMWTIAEGTDQSAIEAFGERYPNLREELLKRIKTINALKSGNRPLKTGKVPTFQNTKVEQANRNIVWASLAFAVFAVFAFGMYRATTHPAPLPPVNPVNLDQATVPNLNTESVPIKGMDPMKVPQGNQAPQNPAANVPSIPNPNTEPTTITGSLKTLKLESAPLQTAILLIAESGHFTVTIAPGMSNPTVKIDYVNMEPMEMLKELGEQYAFTPVIDGPRAILIIPKKDEDEGQITGNNG